MRCLGLCAGVMLLSFALTAGDDGNLLGNGGLMEGGGAHTPGWVFSKWQLKEGTPEAAAVKWGIVKDKDDQTNNCLWLAITAKAKSYIWFQQEVKCDPSETYTLTFRAKGGAVDDGSKGHPGCGFYVLSPEGKWLLFDGFKDVSFSPEWRNYKATITTSEDAGKIGVRLGFSGDGVFEMFFDDVKLVKGTPRPDAAGFAGESIKTTK